MMDPRSVVETIPGFSGAEVAGRLSAGPTNDSFEVVHGGERYVLRLDRPEATRLGLDRIGERIVCEAIAAAGLAPPPVHFDPAAGIYLRRYLPGRSWVREDLESVENLERLAIVLRRLHSMPPAGPIFNPLSAAARYARQIGTPEAGVLYGHAAGAFAAILPAEPALCHNDLVFHNVLEGEALALIDWEYAGIGDPFFDLAVVVQHHSLADRLADGFLKAYLQRDVKDADRDRLQRQRRFYRVLLKLWSLRVATT